MYVFKGVFVQSSRFFELVYPPDLQAGIAERVDVLCPCIEPGALADHASELSSAELIFTGWGAPEIEDILEHCPQARVVFFGGGAAGRLLDRRLWERGIQLTSAYAANAVPVAEYALAAILMGLKGGWRSIMEIKLAGSYRRRTEVPGAMGSVVGLISFGVIARELLARLSGFDIRARVYDPFISDAEILSLGAEPCGLEELFATCDAISLHTPELPETVGMVTGRHLASMKHGATFVNTARGSLVCEDELCRVARSRPDLQFVLDVVSPEPPPSDSPLFSIPNIIVTPHIAGAMGAECRRLGASMVEELDRFLRGEPLRWLITPSLAERSIHRPPHVPPAAAILA